MVAYQKMICKQLNSYRELRFADKPELFDPKHEDTESGSPVFLRGSADHNVLKNPNGTQASHQKLLKLITGRHRWFRSMKSSQAIAQSLFGNLIVSGKLDALSVLRGDDDLMLFGSDGQPIDRCNLEHSIHNNPLKERASTEIDAFFPGEYQVAVECKLTESHVGPCTIPGRKNGLCCGSLHNRPKPADRCYLDGKGIKYWELVPELFDWEFKTNSSPCPLQLPYQLVRNILSVCVREDSKIDHEKGHVVLVYDDRNPAFQSGGKGCRAWQECKTALKFPGLLQKCSWQTIVGCLRNDPDLLWLSDEIDSKYGIC